MRRKSKQVHANAMGMTDGESSTAQQLNAELTETRRRLAALQEEARRLGVELVAATERADKAEATVEAVDEERKAVLRRAERAEDDFANCADVGRRFEARLAEVTQELREARAIIAGMATAVAESAPDAQEPESQHHPEPVELKPGVYRHYKGMLYRVYGTARDSTDGPLEGRTMVRYSSMRTGDSHVRELGQFLRTLPNGKQRFTWERP